VCLPQSSLLDQVCLQEESKIPIFQQYTINIKPKGGVTKDVHKCDGKTRFSEFILTESVYENDNSDSNFRIYFVGKFEERGNSE
jgi:hypothetical protein